MDDLTPARGEGALEHADQARDSKLLATMRRDLDIDFDPAQLVLAPPDRSTAEGDLPPLRVPQPPAPSGRARRRGCPRPSKRRSSGFERCVVEGAPQVRARPPSWRRRPRRIAEDDACASSPASSTGSRRRCAMRASRRARRREFPRAWQRRLEPAEDTEIAAYLVDPNRSGYALDDLAAEYGIEARAGPRGRAGDGGARPPGGGDARARAAPAGAPRALELVPLYREVELPLPRPARRWRTRASRSTPTGWVRSRPRLADQVEELEARAHELAGEPFLLGSTQQVARSCSRRSASRPGRKGKTGYSTDTRVLRAARTSTRSCR